jgi:hypothetical protein
MGSRGIFIECVIVKRRSGLLPQQWPWVFELYTSKTSALLNETGEQTTIRRRITA